MLLPSIAMGLAAVILGLVAYTRGNGEHITGLKTAWSMTVSTLPLLLAAFVLAGFLQALLPRAQFARFLCGESGIRGILIVTLAGALTPRGPFVSMPLAAGLLKAGAGIGTLVAFMTSWSLWALARLPIEIGIMGWRFAAIRLFSTCLFPPVAGLLATGIVRLLRMS